MQNRSEVKYLTRCGSMSQEGGWVPGLFQTGSFLSGLALVGGGIFDSARGAGILAGIGAGFSLVKTVASVGLAMARPSASYCPWPIVSALSEFLGIAPAVYILIKSPLEDDRINYIAGGHLFLMGAVSILSDLLAIYDANHPRNQVQPMSTAP